MGTCIPRQLGVVALFAIAATGCQPGSKTSGIDGTGARTPVAAAAYGRMAGLTSFIVNGVTYDTTNTAVIVDGKPGRISDIATGDVVLVTSQGDSTPIDTAVAQAAVLEHAVVGPVDFIDAGNPFIVALGQPILLESAIFDASIAPASTAGLAVGDIVEVSGFRDQRTQIIASRIAKRSAGTPGFRASGRIANLDATAKRFQINSLIVDYSAAVVTAGPSGSLSAGTFVEVSGVSVDPAGVLAAERVAFRPTEIAVSAGAYVSIEGFVTALDPANPQSFEVAGLPITTTSTTEKNGAIGFDARTEVKGALGTSGSVIASDVRTDLRIPPGANLLQGLVFDAFDGPIANAAINVWVQTRTSGFSWWYVTGRGYYSSADGRYEVSRLPSAQIQLWAGGAFQQGYVQPCAVTFDMTSDVVRDIEVVSIATLNSTAPQRPITARGPALTGTVYEVTPAGRQPVAGAFIWVDGQDHNGLVVAQTMTDLNGQYFLCDLPPGAVYDIYKDGFVPKPFEAIDTSQSTSFDFEIERE